MENIEKYSALPEKMSRTRVDEILHIFKDKFANKGHELDHDKEYFIVRDMRSEHTNEYHIPKIEKIPQKDGEAIDIEDDLQKLLDTLE